MSNKRVWRPFNTYGLIVITSVVASVIVYNILELSRACGL